MAFMILFCSMPLLTPSSSRTSATDNCSSSLGEHKNKHETSQAGSGNKHCDSKQQQKRTYCPSTHISWNLGACLASDNGGEDSQAHTSATLQSTTFFFALSLSFSLASASTGDSLSSG